MLELKDGLKKIKKLEFGKIAVPFGPCVLYARYAASAMHGTVSPVL